VRDFVSVESHLLVHPYLICLPVQKFSMNVLRNSERAENLTGFASMGAHVCRGLPGPFDLHMTWAVQSAPLVAANVPLPRYDLKYKILRPITVGVFLDAGADGGC
jgi:hypothetical protein